jgi:hypothetical protein
LAEGHSRIISLHYSLTKKLSVFGIDLIFDAYQKKKILEDSHGGYDAQTRIITTMIVFEIIVENALCAVLEHDPDKACSTGNPRGPYLEDLPLPPVRIVPVQYPIPGLQI